MKKPKRLTGKTESHNVTNHFYGLRYFAATKTNRIMVSLVFEYVKFVCIDLEIRTTE